jgi:hypothetical protein
VAASTTTDRLLGIRAKIERAKHHVRDLESRILAFRETDPYRLLCEKDSQTGERIFRVQVRHPLPQDIALIVGEAAYQLRSSLDHLAWQLVEANGQASGDWTYFPISESLAKHEAGSPRKVQGMSAAAISLIDAAKPYKGGNNGLWKLHQLNNFDKHRLLPVVAFAVKNLGFSFTAALTPNLLEFGHPAVRDLIAQVQRSMDSEVNRTVPLGQTVRVPIFHDDAEVARIAWPDGPDLKMDEKLDFSFEIAFSDPEIVQCEPVVPFLHQLTHLVDGIVGRFLPLL